MFLLARKTVEARDVQPYPYASQIMCYSAIPSAFCWRCSTTATQFVYLSGRSLFRSDGCSWCLITKHHRVELNCKYIFFSFSITFVFSLYFSFFFLLVTTQVEKKGRKKQTDMRWGGQGKYRVYTFNTLFNFFLFHPEVKGTNLEVCVWVLTVDGWWAHRANKWAEEGTRGRNIESKFQLDAIVCESEREKTHNHICIHIRYIWKEMGDIEYIYRWQRMMWNQERKIFEEGKIYVFHIYIYQDMTKYLQERFFFVS